MLKNLVIRGLAVSVIPSLSLIPLYLPLPQGMSKYSKFHQPELANSYLHSFLPPTIKLWNRLPEHSTIIVSAQSVEHFRELIFLNLYPLLL